MSSHCRRAPCGRPTQCTGWPPCAASHSISAAPGAGSGEGSGDGAAAGTRAKGNASILLVADADLAAIVVRGHAPHAFPGGLHLTVTAGDDVARQNIITTKPFAIAMPRACPRDGRVRLVIEASASFRPQDAGGADTRDLSYVLARIDAVEAAS
jgi:hypothetical protein